MLAPTDWPGRSVNARELPSVPSSLLEDRSTHVVAAQADGPAHDLKNPRARIRAPAQLLQRCVKRPEPLDRE
jgi:nitrogen-specific signal transduction histidine kinase